MQTKSLKNSYQGATLPRIMVLGLVVLLIVFAVVLAHFSQEKTLVIQSKPGYVISVGTPNANEDGLGIDKLIAKTTTGLNERLKKGTYVVLFSKSGYAPTYQNISLTHNFILTPPVLDYTSQTLSTLLAQQSPAIAAAFQNSSSGSLLAGGYSIQNIGLYHDGSWYAGRLVPADSSQNDPLVFIMHQQNGQWLLATTPAITLYIGDHTNIPSDVLSAADGPSSAGS